MFSPNAQAKDTDPFNCAARKDVSACNRESLSELANQNCNEAVTYEVAREQMYQIIDVFEDEDGARVVESVYTPTRYEVGDCGIPQNGVTAEHTYPQSRFEPYPRNLEAKTDLHHLFPLEGRENSRRNNHPFADCGGENKGVMTKGILCKAGYEPPTKQKGIAARAMFYMAVMYSLPITDAEEIVLRKWNTKYKASRSEIERNQRIIDVQGNTNPFVEHEEWVNLVSDY